MPTYEYVCQKCGHSFEKYQSISASPLTVCPEELCGNRKWGRGKVVRAISGGAGLPLKGSGFYITDYRSESYRQAAKKDSGAATGSSKESKSADPKPAATSASPSPKAKAA